MQTYLSLRARVCLLLSLSVCVFELYTVGFGVLSPLVQRATLLLFSAVMVFLLFPAANWPEKAELSAGRRSVAIAWDISCIAIAFVTCLFLILEEDALADRSGAETQLDLIMAVAGPVMLLEMVRRSVGLPLFLIALGAIVYTYFGDVFIIVLLPVVTAELLRRFASPKAAAAFVVAVALSLLIPDIRGLLDPSIYPFQGERLDRMAAYLWLTSEGTYGTIAAIMSQFIFIFILFAGLLESTGAGQVFIRLAFALTGRYRGGPAQAAVAASSMFGMVSGSTMANVVSTGAFTIPLMIRTGFTRVFAGAVEAVASCGGQIVPPIMGASVFIMSEIIGVSYAKLMLYALIPAVLYFASLSCAIYFESLRLGLERLPRSEIPIIRDQIRAGGYLLIPILMLLVSIIGGETPGLAGFKATITLLVLIDLVRALREANGEWGRRGVAAVCVFGLFLLALCVAAAGAKGLFQFSVPLPVFGETPVLRLLLAGVAVLCLGHPALRRFPVILPVALAVADWSGFLSVGGLVEDHVWAAVAGIAFLALVALLLKGAAGSIPTEGALETGLAPLGRAIVDGFDKGAKNAMSLVAATYVIGTIVGLLVLTAAGVRISILVTDMASTSLFLAFFLVMIASLVMGMGLPTVAAYLLLVIVVAPAIGKLGAPIVAAHMFIFYYGVLSSITPPVALAAYGASGLSKADPLRTAVMACRLAITAFIVPYLFVYHPELLLLEGSLLDSMYRLAVCGSGIFLVSMAAIGQGWVTLGFVSRAVLLAAALMLFMDMVWLNACGAVIGAGQLLMQHRQSRADAGSSAA